MSLFSTFLAHHLIPALESALVAHEPEAQAAILAEIKVLTDKLAVLIESKVNAPATDNKPVPPSA